MGSLGTVKRTGKGTEVNGEGPEKTDGTSTATGDLSTANLHDDHPKIAGLSEGKKMYDNKVALGTQTQ
jgi:hypothetical protein